MHGDADSGGAGGRQYGGADEHQHDADGPGVGDGSGGIDGDHIQRDGRGDCEQSVGDRDGDVGGSSQSVTFMLAPMQVATLACNPTTLGPSSTSSCTVTLSQAAPAGGSTVALTNTNPTLTVPASVTVAAAATSATFNATTGTFATSQSATVTATLGSSSQT